MVQRPLHQQGRLTRTGATRNREVVVPPGPTSTALPSAASVMTSFSSSSSKMPPIFWQLVGASALLYYGPLGDVVGEVPGGTVIRELRRFRDLFGCWWLASRASDGSMVWILLSMEDATQDDETTHWQRVYDERCLPSGPLSLNGIDEQAMLQRAVIPTDMSIENIPSKDILLWELKLLEESMHNMVPVPDGGRDWNAEYQHLVELTLFSSWEESVSASKKLHTFMETFSEAAEEAALTVITDMLRPSSDRVAKNINSGTIGTFIYNNLLVRLAIDDGGGGFKGDADAWRRISQSMQAVQLISVEGPKRFLCTPPTVVITFSGFRCSVMAIPPVEVKSVVYLPLQESDDSLDIPNTIKFLLTDLGQALGLKEHHVKLITGGDISITLPAGATVVAGRDKRLYLMNISHLFPTMATFTDGVNKRDETLSLRFRPEFLLSWKGKPLSADAFVKDAAAPEDNAGVLEATDCVRDQLIPTIAAILGLYHPVDIPRQESIGCTLCSRIMTNELRFVVCHGVDMCCCICSHCYTQRLYNNNDTDEQQQEYRKKNDYSLFSDAVKCDTAPRGPKGLLMEPSITSIFHANGLNMRFLPYVYYRLPQLSRFAMAHYCEIEMVARAARRIVREKLRRTAQTLEEIKTVSQEFFLSLLQSSGDKAEGFWMQELGPTLEKMYGLQEPFNTSCMDIELLYHRVAQLSGIYLDNASIASFHTEKPYLQLAAVRPVRKMIRPPIVADEVSHEKIRSAFRRHLEGILLFWIGFSVESEDVNESEVTQPFYMMEEKCPM